MPEQLQGSHLVCDSLKKEDIWELKKTTVSKFDQNPF